MTWTIGTAGGDVVADHLVGELYTPRISEEIAPTFRFSPNQALATPESRFEELLPYVSNTSEKRLRTSQGSDGTAYYRENTTNLADVDSFLVSIEAPNDLNFASVWGVIVGGRDRSNSVRTALRWELEIVVLASFDEYADRTSAEAALEEVVL
ncbi:hypothetical protein ACFQJC_04950 [Haloferax namakaokahaiae]|uniref:Uncharacterized protein n=1 Tax=Haloferax namakaokahaiae TaxID=1748331 RepID=A0ABD5ZD69_9EURY